MKKKKWLVFFLIVLACILIFVFAINFLNKRKSIDDLVSQLEKSVNSSDLKSIVNLYPDYYHDTVFDLLSQDKLDEFKNKTGDIEINIVNKTNYDLSQAKDIQNKIENNYKINLMIEDYQIVIVNITNNVGSVFEQTQLEVIRMGGEYYLYAQYFLGDLIQCFAK